MKEFWFSSTAIRQSIDNRPSQQVFANLVQIGAVMDKIRQFVGKPIRITSGYRCPKLNTIIGGAKNSQHVKGQAIDFQVVGYSNKQLFELFKELSKAYIVVFDQLIWQYNSWIHISISDKPRKQCLIINSVGTNTYSN